MPRCGPGAIQSDVAERRFAYGRGCATCNGTGYKGRMAIFEIMLLTESLRQLIIDGVSSDAIREQARREGMRTLREDGLLKVLSGHTSIEEIARAVG